MVAHGFPLEGLGGAEAYTRDLAVALSRLDVEVEVLFPCVDRERERPVLRSDRAYGLELHRIELSKVSALGLVPWDPEIETLFRSLLYRGSFDLVHFQHTWAALPFSLLEAARDTGHPVALTMHDFWFGCPRTHLLVEERRELCDGPASSDLCGECVASQVGTAATDAVANLTRAVERRAERAQSALEACDLVTAPSRYLLDKVRRYELVPEDKLELAPLGLGFHKRVRSRRVRPLTFAFLGSLSTLKNPAALVRAFRRVRGDAQLLLVGPGMADQIDELKLMIGEDPRIQMRGALANHAISVLFSEIDVLVHPSLVENYPVVAREALSVGVPVLGSRRGGLPEIVEHMKNGILFDPLDEDALAGWLQRLLDEPELLEQLRAGIEPVKSIGQDALEWRDRYVRLAEAQVSATGAPSWCADTRNACINATSSAASSGE
jgi:glycosyltransferase involved in cell wall biosynthesis